MTTIAPGLQSLIDKAKADLAQRLSIAISELNIVEATEVAWPDASLGCPKMGVMYIQVVTLGFQIVLETGGKEYIYHTDKKERVLFCPEPHPGGKVTPSLYQDK